MLIDQIPLGGKVTLCSNNNYVTINYPQLFYFYLSFRVTDRSVCHKLACVSFPTKKRNWIFTTTSRYRLHLAIVRHNTNLAIYSTQSSDSRLLFDIFPKKI